MIIISAFLLFVIPTVLILGIFTLLINFILAILTGLINGFTDGVCKAIDSKSKK